MWPLMSERNAQALRVNARVLRHARACDVPAPTAPPVPLQRTTADWATRLSTWRPLNDDNLCCYIFEGQPLLQKGLGGFRTCVCCTSLIRRTLIPFIAPPKMLLTQLLTTAQADLSRVCSLTSAQRISFSGLKPTSHAAPSRLARALWSPAARRLGWAMFQGLPVPSAHRQQRRSLGGSSVQL